MPSLAIPGAGPSKGNRRIATIVTTNCNTNHYLMLLHVPFGELVHPVIAILQDSEEYQCRLCSAAKMLLCFLLFTFTRSSNDKEVFWNGYVVASNETATASSTNSNAIIVQQCANQLKGRGYIKLNINY